MILISGAYEYTINNPQWGYETIIKLSLVHIDISPKGYVIWDNDVSNDYRICKFSCLLNATQTDNLLTLYKNTGRGLNVTLRLAANSGFYPFGPDLGDTGDFSVRLMNIKPGRVLEEPWQHFETDIEMVLVTNPEYSLPSEVDEGDLQIGSITGLRYPPDFPSSNTYYKVSNQMTYDGTPYTIDKTSQGDSLHTSFKMLCNHSKSAALINHLVNTVRGDNVSIISQANNWLFGTDGLTSGTYTCKMMNNSIVVTHEYYNGFSFNLSFYKV